MYSVVAILRMITSQRKVAQQLAVCMCRSIGNVNFIVHFVRADAAAAALLLKESPCTMQTQQQIKQPLRVSWRHEYAQNHRIQWPFQYTPTWLTATVDTPPCSLHHITPFCQLQFNCVITVVCVRTLIIFAVLHTFTPDWINNFYLYHKTFNNFSGISRSCAEEKKNQQLTILRVWKCLHFWMICFCRHS